jgi:hypothetical protein
MSALGQKRTFGPGNSMSALPPKADIRTGMTGNTPPLHPEFYRRPVAIDLIDRAAPKH